MCDRNVDELPCRQRPCLPPRERSPAEEANAGLKGRPVLYTGVVWIGIVRRFLIPRTCGSSSLSQRPQDGASYESTTASPPKVVAHVQAVDSPYREPPLRYKQSSVPVPLIAEHAEKNTGDQKTDLLRKRSEGGSRVRVMHETLATITEQARVISDDLSAILRDGQESAAEVIGTVRSEDGRNFRLAAISASGLLGYLAGQKRGMFPRLVYTITGATAMATICYPEETKIYNQLGLTTVRRWIVLGLSFVHSGPQKPLGSGNTGESYNSHTNDQGTKIPKHNEPSQTNSVSTENIISNLMQNLGSLGSHLEVIKARLKDNSSTTVDNESANKNVMDSAYQHVSDNTNKSSLENLHYLQEDGFENRSSNNDKNKMKDISPGSIPYSPALPIPPKEHINLGTVRRKEDAALTDRLHGKIPIARKQSREFFQSETTDELSSVVDDEDDDRHNEDDDGYDGDDDDGNGYDNTQHKTDPTDFSDLTFVVPTGGLDEKFKDKRENITKNQYKETYERPLNKKLADYYRNIPEEEKTSREKGYKDAYSNRGK